MPTPARGAQGSRSVVAAFLLCLGGNGILQEAIGAIKLFGEKPLRRVRLRQRSIVSFRRPELPFIM